MGGFYHGSVNSDSYVVLAGGGYKSVNDFLLSQDHYKTSPGAGTAGTSSATSGSTLSVPYVTVNANGHVTGYGTHTHTISGFLTAQDHYKTSPGAGTAGTSSATSGSTLSVPYVTINANGHVTGYGTHTHTISGFLTALDHYKTSPGAGTAGTSSATSGSALAIPYITVNANGHVTGYGTHTHTITGFAAEHTHPYLPLAGGTMTGTIIMDGASFEQTGKRWMYGSTRNSGFKYDYSGNEAFIISAGSYASAAISLYSGNRLALNDSNGQWNATVADMQIKLNCVGIGANVDTAYKLYVNGTIKSSGFYHSSVLSDSYVLLAGGGYKALSYFSTTDTNTWRKVQLNGTDKLGTGTGTNPLNIKAGTGMSITESSGTFTFNCTVTGSNSVAWVDVTDKIHGGNEFNMVNSGYSSTLWFNYCPVNDRSGSASVSEYIFGNGNKGKADICANTVYPSATNSYYLGKSSYVYAGAYTRFIQSDSALSLKTNGNNTRVYINTSGNVGVGTTSPIRKLHVIGEAVIGESSYTAPQSTGSSYSGTWIGQGWLELSTTDPYIDFHRNKSTADYTSRLIHWNDKVRLKYENSDSTYSGYVLTCEGNHHNPVILGIFDLRRWKPDSTSWSLDNICGPCYFELKNTWGSDVSYSDSSSSWTIPSNLLRVEITGTLGANYTTKTTVKAAACIGTVMTRWINNHPVVANRSHSDWQGCSVECLCTNKAPGNSLYYDSQLPGKYIYITGSRPWGYDDDSNGLAMDQFRQTGNLSYQRVRFVVYGWLE